MTTTYWILAAVAYLVCGIVTAAMVREDIRHDAVSDWLLEYVMLYSAVLLWPLVAPGLAINWLASKLRKGNHDA